MSESYVESWLTGPESTQFYCRTYSPVSPKAVLVFLHGFIEHIGRYEHIFPQWQNRGISVFTFDLRGFGKTADGAIQKGDSKAYGRTSGIQQLGDAEWALKHAKEQAGEIPMFLMGHSMGGGVVLTFATRGSSGPPAPSTLALLSGVIATAPLILQTTPASKVTRFIGGGLSTLAPHKVIPAKVKAEDLTHDQAVNEAYLKDPLVKQQGTLKGISDMLDGGEALLKDYVNWPADLPVLLVHGTEDKVTSCIATEQFFQKLPAKDKTFTPYPGGYHELQSEPNGVKEKLVEECISWVEAHIPSDGTTRGAKL